jgi:hypothetical protein
LRRSLTGISAGTGRDIWISQSGTDGVVTVIFCTEPPAGAPLLSPVDKAAADGVGAIKYQTPDARRFTSGEGAAWAKSATKKREQIITTNHILDIIDTPGLSIYSSAK